MPADAESPPADEYPVPGRTENAEDRPSKVWERQWVTNTTRHAMNENDINVGLELDAVLLLLNSQIITWRMASLDEVFQHGSF